MTALPKSLPPASQWPPRHRTDEQSVSLLQPLPVSQRVHEPPQSTSDSLPSFAPLAHIVGAHAKHGPPQSIPVSPWFCTSSMQLGCAQRPKPHASPSHTRLVQSFAVAQPFPSAHGGQWPPQSTSVSSPFLS